MKRKANEEYPENLDRRILAALMEMSREDLRNFDEELLARFACGWVTEEERDQAITILAHSQVARSRLLEMRASLESGSQASLSKDSILVDVVRRAVGALVSLAVKWRKLCPAALSGQAGSLDEKRSFGVTLGQLIDTLSALRLNVAFTRGGADSERPVAIVPVGTVVSLQVSMEEDSMKASVEFDDDAETPRELTLILGAPGTDTIYCGTSAVNGRSWRLEIPNPPARLADLDLAGAPFGLIAGGDTMPPPITVDVQDRDQVVTAWVRPTAPPHVEKGELRLSISIPPDLRAQWAGRTLSLTVRVAGVRLVIGRWAVDELPREEVIELRAPLEGAEDGKLELTSILLLELSR